MPGINSLVSMIKSRRRRDSIILGVLIGTCTIILLTYLWNWGTVWLLFMWASTWPANGLCTIMDYSHGNSVFGDICVHFDENDLVAVWTTRPLGACIDAMFYLFVTDNVVFEEMGYDIFLFTLCCLDGGVWFPSQNLSQFSFKRQTTPRSSSFPDHVVSSVSCLTSAIVFVISHVCGVLMLISS